MYIMLYSRMKVNKCLNVLGRCFSKLRSGLCTHQGACSGGGWRWWYYPGGTSDVIPPPDHVLWYMNGSMVKPSDLYLISNISVSDASTVPITYNASLTISSVNLTTQGFYWASFYGYFGVFNTSFIFLLSQVGKNVLQFSLYVSL